MEPVALIALITSVVVLAGAIVAFMAKVNQKITEIHVVVNSRFDEALAYIKRLEANAYDDDKIPNPERPDQKD